MSGAPPHPRGEVARVCHLPFKSETAEAALWHHVASTQGGVSSTILGMPVQMALSCMALLPCVPSGVPTLWLAFPAMLTISNVSLQGYTLPRPMMANSDIARIINSDEIQSVVRPARSGLVRKPLKKNPMKNLGALLKLNPYANVARRIAITSSVSHKTL